MVTVYIPEYVVGHWWEQILHNQSALRLKARLLFTPGVMVTSVPYLLQSSGKAEERLARDDRRSRRRRSYLGPDRRPSDRGGRSEVGPVAHGGHCVARWTGGSSSSGTRCRASGC